MGGMTSDDRPRSRKAINQARYRQRDRRGVRSYRIEVVENDLAEALIRSGQLSEDSAQIRHEIEQALEEILNQFVSDWTQERCR